MAGAEPRRGAGLGNGALGSACSRGLSRASQESSGDRADPPGQSWESLPFPEPRLPLLEIPLKKQSKAKLKAKQSSALGVCQDKSKGMV